MSDTIPQAPAPRPQQRRYSMTIVSLARRMYDDGNAWSPTQIRDYLEAQHGAEGLALMTVRRWVVPGADEVERRRNSESYHRRKTRGPNPAHLDTPAKRLARLELLRAKGLSFAGLAIVFEVDTGVQLSADQMRHLFRYSRKTRLPARTCRTLMGEAA